MTTLALPLPEVVWGVFVRLVGLVYLIAFGSLWPQVLAIAGSHGTTPVARLLAAYRRDYPGWRRFAHQPTLLWISPSDWMLRLLVAAGIIAAVAVMVGGPWSTLALAVCWLAWLSLDSAIELLYPWDCLLFEVGLLSLFLPALRPLPELAMVTAPLPVVVVAYQILLARLLVGFGKIKFKGTTRKDLGYLREFVINQPMPSKLGWLAHRAPGFVFTAGMGVLFAAEVVLPFVAFLPGWPRLVAAAGIVLLMIGIQLAGNFGYFNLLTIVICVGLLDAQTTLLDVSASEVASWPLTHLALATWAFLGLVYVAFNSWCTRTWPHWPFWENVQSRIVRATVALARGIAPFRIVHSYGVFPPQTIPGVKFAAVVEATRDGEEWREYQYRYFPCDEYSPPRFIAPHHPRWDHYILYDGLGHKPDGLAASLIGNPHPYHFYPWGPVDRLLQRLLEGRSEMRAFFRSDPFDDGKGPPTRARVTLYLLEPTTPGERKATGRWWRRTRLSEHYPERARDDARWDDWPGDPLLFHWDHRAYKKAAPVVREFMGAARSAESLEAMERAVTTALSAQGRPTSALDSFWSEFLPTGGAAPRNDWEELPAAAARVNAAFARSEILEFERVANLLSMGLAERYHWRIFGDPKDYFPLPSYFHVGGLFHSILLQGRAAYERALKDDDWVMAEAARFHPARALWLCGLLRWDTMQFHLRRGHLVSAFAPSTYQPGLPGFMLLAEWVSLQLWDPDEEALPLFTRDIRDGRWRLEGWEGEGRVKRRVRVGAIYPGTTRRPEVIS